MQNAAQTYESVRLHISPGAVTPRWHAAPCRLYGVGASPGITEGLCVVVTDLQKLQPFPYGAILVCEAALPVVMPFLPLLGGLIAERGGSLSIVSGYAREHEIPAVFGVARLMDAIHNGDVVRIDGTRGTVDIIG